MSDKIELIFEHSVKPPTYITKYEYVRLVGSRAIQIYQGAEIKIPCTNFNPYEIAKEEIRQCVIPLVIERTTPSGEKIYIKTDSVVIRDY
jgi:DNA-directed RNA polymerase subunit K/omega